MKNTKNKNKIKRERERERERGFTLIELMVVISIIGLLSSIVLVALKDVRQRAQATKFRAEMNQFINALELYRADNGGEYPLEIYAISPIGYSMGYITNENAEGKINAGSDLLSTLMLKYLKSLPKVPANSFNKDSEAYYYLVNTPVLVNSLWRCKGDIYTPKYIILFQNKNPTIYNIYSDLPIAEMFQGLLWSDQSNYKCFSLK